MEVYQLAKIVVPEDMLTQLRKEIAERGEAVLVAAHCDETYVVRPAGDFFDPSDEEELSIVLEAAGETDGPLLTAAEAREHLHRLRSGS